MKQSLLIGTLIGCALFGGAVSSAQAATIGCADSRLGANVSDNISGSIGCEISGTIGANNVFTLGANNDFVGNNPNNPTNPSNFTVNTQKFFGASDWLFAGKSDGSLSAYFEPDKGSPAKFEGIYDFSTNPLRTLLNNATNVMLIFKSGQGTSLVGYLLDNRVDPYQGWWTTPFMEPLFSFPGNTTSRDVSHISVYYRNGAPLAIPTPALLPGLVAFGLSVLRKQQQADPDA